MSDKSREEFEAWYLAEYFEGDKDCGLEWLSVEPCGSYRYERPSTQWKVWKASRESIVIDLSDLSRCFSPSDCGDWAMWLDDVRVIAQKAGLKVKL